MSKILRKEKVYADEWLTFFRGQIQHTDGSLGEYTWVERKNGVGVVLLTKDNKIFLHSEYRFVIDRYGWEIPGGGIDSNEDPGAAAIRELEEETGIRVEKVEQLTTLIPLASFNTETVTVFTAYLESIPSLTTDKSESGEDVAKQKFFTFDEIESMIDKGEIDDALTVAAVQMVIRSKRA